MIHYVYILECADSSLYVGSTKDLAKRLKEHNESKRGAHYTKIRRPVFLRYSETFATLKEARSREAELKSWPRAKKLHIIKMERSKIYGMSRKETAISILQGQGHRITNVRKTVVELLEKSRSPISADEIREAFKKRNVDVHKTTVYRELDFLRGQRIVQEVEFGDKKKRYEISGQHHHHLICVECKRVKDVDLQQDLDAVEKKIAKEKGFQITGHSLEFFGVCAKCGS